MGNGKDRVHKEGGMTTDEVAEKLKKIDDMAIPPALPKRDFPKKPLYALATILAGFAGAKLGPQVGLTSQEGALLGVTAGGILIGTYTITDIVSIFKGIGR